MVALFSIGEFGGKAVYPAKALDDAMDYLIRRGQRRQAPFSYYYYGTYYASQVLYQAGKERWPVYRERMFGWLLKEQGADGSWTGTSTGPVLATGFSLLSLQVENGFLPIFQR